MLDFLFTVVDDGIIDFTTLELSGKPNQYLMLPEGEFIADPHAISPVLKVRADDLAKYFRDVVKNQKKVTLIRESDDGRQLDYVQRTFFMGYPDTITVNFIDKGADTSTLAIFSRSSYGYSDLGANRRRVQQWLADRVYASNKHNRTL